MYDAASFGRRAMRRIALTVLAVGCAAFTSAQTSTPKATAGAERRSAPGTVRAQHLAATPKTVAWGYYDAAAPPVLRIKSGDVVTFDTLITSSPQRLEQAGVKPADVQQSLRDIYDQVTNKG